MPDQPRVLKFGVFEVDLIAGEVRKAGMRQKLAGQPFQVLQALLEHPHEIVTREELRQRIWLGNTVIDFDLALKKAVNRLREVLGDSADSPRFIETIPRRGYRFIAAVELPSPPRQELEPATPAVKTTGLAPNEQQIPALRIRPLGVLGIALALAVVLLAFKVQILTRNLRARLSDARTSVVPETIAPRHDEPEYSDSELLGDVSYVLSTGVVDTTKFFESGWGDVPRNDRRYATAFDGSLARYINWELHLKFPSVGRTARFGVKAIYTNAQGAQVAVQNRQCRLDLEMSDTWCTYGWGSKNPGGWDPGYYTVKLFIGTKKVSEKTFRIT